jgi:hypothetical protein
MRLQLAAPSTSDQSFLKRRFHGAIGSAFQHGNQSGQEPGELHG